MISHAFTVFVIASAAFLAACGGGGSSSTPAASGAPSVAPALDAAEAFLTKYDALLATAIPTPGAANKHFAGSFVRLKATSFLTNQSLSSRCMVINL